MRPACVRVCINKIPNWKKSNFTISARPTDDRQPTGSDMNVSDAQRRTDCRQQQRQPHCIYYQICAIPHKCEVWVYTLATLAHYHTYTWTYTFTAPNITRVNTIGKNNNETDCIRISYAHIRNRMQSVANSSTYKQRYRRQKREFVYMWCKQFM